MAEHTVNTKFTADTSDFQKGANAVSGELNKISKNLKGSSITKVTSSVKGLLGAVGAATVAAKAALKVIKETTDAYRVQQKAEKQLEVAAKNNPLLNEKSVTNLKNYASQLQSIGVIGDEQLLPMMAQLVSLGKSESEVQKIMSAALDLSASGMMSMEQAVKQLNATTSGNIGLLGRQIPELKNLTAEQLKNGDAIDIVAKKFKGMSESVTRETGSVEQLKNAWGDFLEAIGEKTEKKLAGLRRGFTEFLNWSTNAVKTFGKTEDLDTQEKLNEYQRQRNILNEEYNQLLKEGVPLQNSEVQGVLKKLEYYNKEIAILQTKIDLDKKSADAKKAQAKADAKQAEIDDRNKKALEFMSKNQADLDKEIEQIELRARLKGEEADKQEILNAMMNSYINLVTGSDLVTENNPFSKKRLAEIQEYAKGIVQVVDNFEEFKNAVDELQDIFSQFESITSNVTALFRDSLSDETEKDLANLSEQYTDGIIDYEEYCNKKNELSKKAAQEEYKLKMWEWSASLLSATASIAQGVAAALSKDPPASYIMAALTGAAGAVQIATLVANKPKPPQFANGGIVPGNSYNGDRVVARVNSGEMILNSAQQGNLWNMLNNGGGMGINMPVTINNTASDKVSASAQMSKNGLIITVNDIVNSQMQKGVYTGSMNIANARAEGVRLL